MALRPVSLDEYAELRRLRAHIDELREVAATAAFVHGIGSSEHSAATGTLIAIEQRIAAILGRPVSSKP